MEKNNTPAKTQVYNLVILDKSGSMEDIRKEAIDGYNETLGAIRAAQLKHMDTQDHFVSLAAFCDCGIDMIYDMTPIKDAEGTKEMFRNENAAQRRFYKKMACASAAAPYMSPEDRKKMRKKFSKEYYDKDKK